MTLSIDSRAPPIFTLIDTRRLQKGFDLDANLDFVTDHNPAAIFIQYFNYCLRRYHNIFESSTSIWYPFLTMAKPRWLNKDEARTWRSYLAACHLLFDQLDHELQRDAGIPHTYYEILVRLSEAPQRSMRMSELASCSQSSRSRLSHAVSRLEELGWVRRESCPTDRRGANAVLTEKGFEVIEKAAPGHVEGVRKHLFDQLSQEQIGQLGEISQAMVKHLSNIRSQRAPESALND